MQAPTDSAASVAAPEQQHQQPPPATRHSPQGAASRHWEGGQSRRRTAAPRRTAGCGPRPGPAPADARPAAALRADRRGPRALRGVHCWHAARRAARAQRGSCFLLCLLIINLWMKGVLVDCRFSRATFHPSCTGSSFSLSAPLPLLHSLRFPF